MADCRPPVLRQASIFGFAEQEGAAALLWTASLRQGPQASTPPHKWGPGDLLPGGSPNGATPPWATIPSENQALSLYLAGAVTERPPGGANPRRIGFPRIASSFPKDAKILRISAKTRCHAQIYQGPREGPSQSGLRHAASRHKRCHGGPTPTSRRARHPNGTPGRATTHCRCTWPLRLGHARHALQLGLDDGEVLAVQTG